MATNGNNFKTYIGATDVYVTAEMSSSININGATIDISSKDTAWATYIAGQKSWDASCTLHLDNTNTQHKAIISALFNGTSLQIFNGVVSGTTRTYGYAGNVFVTSIKHTAENNGIVSMEVSFQGSGALTPVNLT